MIQLIPDEVRSRFGPLFAQRFLVMVDERSRRAEILEHCHARGTIEWDAMNRMRAKGATVSCNVEGTSMIMQARLGVYPASFGAASQEIGGQALEGVEVSGDEVVTSWAGIAGAGVGVAACLPQAPGVIRAEYPSDEDLKVGGARVCRVRIVSPRYEKVIFGIDDTDTKEKGATWVTALKCAEACRIPGVEFLGMRLIQLNPAVPKKTTNCVGSALIFAVRPGQVAPLQDHVVQFVSEQTVSEDTGIAFYQGIGFPYESPVLERVKTALMTLEEAAAEAEKLGVKFLDTNFRKGRIGALGALLWADKGIEAAGLYGEHL